MPVIDSRHMFQELDLFNFYKDIFVQKKPPKGVLLKSGGLTIFDNPMILLKILA